MLLNHVFLLGNVYFHLTFGLPNSIILYIHGMNSFKENICSCTCIYRTFYMLDSRQYPIFVEGMNKIHYLCIKTVTIQKVKYVNLFFALFM